MLAWRRGHSPAAVNEQAFDSEPSGCRSLEPANPTLCHAGGRHHLQTQTVSSGLRSIAGTVASAAG